MAGTSAIPQLRRLAAAFAGDDFELIGAAHGLTISGWIRPVTVIDPPFSSGFRAGATPPHCARALAGREALDRNGKPAPFR